VKPPRPAAALTKVLILAMPRIINRYLLVEILHPFLVSLLVFTAIVFSGRLMRITQMIVVKGVGLAEILRSCLYLLPSLLVFTLPMAATVGIMLALMRLTVDQEIIALKTAGLSFAQMVAPLVVFSLAIGLGSLFLTVHASPWGNRATRELLTEVMKRRADLGITEQVFNTDFQGMMIFVNVVSSKQGQLEGIFVYETKGVKGSKDKDSQDADPPRTIYAQKGQLSYDQTNETFQLTLYDGWIVSWVREKELTRHQTIKFRNYQLQLDLFLALKEAKSQREQTLEEIYQELAKQSPGSELYNRLVVELNQRFSMPVGALFLCLLAIPLGLSTRQHGRSWGLVVGLLIFLIYYGAFTVSWRLAVHARINPALAPWLPNILVMAMAWYFWRRTLRELPLLPRSWSLRRWFSSRGQTRSQ